MAKYVPDVGDVIWMNFDPQVGHEIMKRRPALVLSAKSYNAAYGFCVVCPISTKPKGHFFEVPITVKRRAGVIKSDQIKSMDWITRKGKLIEKAPKKILAEVRERVATLLFDDMF